MSAPPAQLKDPRDVSSRHVWPGGQWSAIRLSTAVIYYLDFAQFSRIMVDTIIDDRIMGDRIMVDRIIEDRIIKDRIIEVRFM